MALFRSQLMALIEGVCTSLGWAYGASERGLADSNFPNTAPLQVVWRWVSIETQPDPGKPGGPGQPMTKAMTWSLEYAAQVASSVRGDLQYKYLAADVPDLLAKALLDRQAPYWSGVRNVTTEGKNFVHGIEIGSDTMLPPPSINANGKVGGYISFTLRVDIDARTDLEMQVLAEGV